MGGLDHRRPRGLGDSGRRWHSGSIESGSPVLRPTLSTLAAALLGAGALPVQPVLAQAAAATKPATQEEVNTYTTMGAVASCDLAVRQKVPLTKSLPATSSMVAYILLNRHGGQIVGVGNQKLSDEQLFQGSFLQIVGGVRRGCYDRLDASDKKEVDTILAQLEKAAQNQKK